MGSIRKVRYKERDTLRVPILLPQHIPTAIVCTTLTTVLLGGKPIVIVEFFAFFDIPLGNNPDGALGDQHFTIGITGVIDGAGFVCEGLYRYYSSH